MNGTVLLYSTRSRTYGAVSMTLDRNAIAFEDICRMERVGLVEPCLFENDIMTTYFYVALIDRVERSRNPRQNHYFRSGFQFVVHV